MLLAENGANMNCFDMSGRTPLFIAAKLNNLKATKALLAMKANPVYRSRGGLQPIEVATDYVLVSYLTKAKLLYICINFVPKGKRGSLWEKEGYACFISDEDNSIKEFL